MSFGRPAATAAESTSPAVRLTFETAKLALESGEQRLGIKILEELATGAGTGMERDFFLAVIAKVDGSPEGHRALVERATARLEDEREETAPSWIESELLRLAAPVRLSELKESSDAALADVLARHYDALGGLDFAKTLESVIAVGAVLVEGRELQFRLARAQPAYYRLDLATPAGVRVEVYDGQVAWLADPGVQDGKPAYVGGPRGAALRRGAPLAGPLVRHRAAGDRLFYRGLEPFQGHDHHVIEVSSRDGLRERIYLDAETFLATRRVVIGEEAEIATEAITEYREVDGYWLPERQSVRTREGAELVYRFDAYQLNKGVTSSLFDIKSATPGP